MHAPQQQLSLYRLLVENSLGLMCVHDLDGQLLTINPAAAESLGYRVEDSVGRNIREFIAPSVRHLFDDYLERIRTNTVDSGAMRLVARDGTERIWLYRNVRYEESGSSTRVLGHAVDITERITAERALKQSQEDLARARDELELRVAERTAELQETNQRLRSEIEHRHRIEEELLRTRKLDAIGRLAGGIAHDFNNLMTIIVGYCESLRSATASSPILQKQVTEIYKAAEQANSLTRQLLAFSRRQKAESNFLNLNDVLTDMSDMLRRLMSDDIEVTIQTDPELGLICANRGQIEQVIVNIVINAAHAMPRGGKLLLEADNAKVDESCSWLAPDEQQRSFVRLTVSDTGIGMDPEVKARIFDPFFTTKEPGKGTGLGLTTVYGIVKQADGHITVESEREKGSTFQVYFPRVERSFGTEAQPSAVFHGSTRGSETILVVEDLEGLCTLLSEILQKSGYSVLTAPNGREALRLVREHPGRIDLVITDIVMPQMGGWELADQLRALQPGIKILLMSGYIDKRQDVNESGSRGNAFIEKPFTPEALLQTIRDVIAAAANSVPGDKTALSTS
jgi:two-component system, cell cycle sensor histidine kinase and response regulator CckA